jgi:hypothetical protein
VIAPLVAVLWPEAFVAVTWQASCWPSSAVVKM